MTLPRWIFRLIRRPEPEPPALPIILIPAHVLSAQPSGTLTSSALVSAWDAGMRAVADLARTDAPGGTEAAGRAAEAVRAAGTARPTRAAARQADAACAGRGGNATDPDPPTVVVCVPVGQASGYCLAVLPGWETGDCGRCGDPVWVVPGVVEKSPLLLCVGCSGIADNCFRGGSHR